MGLNKTNYIRIHGEEAWEIEKAKRNARKKLYRKGNRVERKPPELTKEEYMKKWREEHKEYMKDAWHKWYENNKERHKEHNKQYQKENKEKVDAYAKKYRTTKYGRAAKLISAYKSFDKKYGRESDFNLTHQWIIDHIFNSKCVYCGEDDWTKLGCDRIDNKKAHTTDNCVCACWTCNNARQSKDFKTFLLSQNPSSASDILSSLGL